MPPSGTANPTLLKPRKTATDDPVASELIDRAAARQSSRALPRIVPIAGWGTIAIAVGVLVGWVFEIEWLKVVVYGLVSMKINTAIGFLLLGSALLLRTSRQRTRGKEGLAIVASLGAVALGAVTICEFVFDWDAGIDQLFIFDDSDPRFFPGRPAIATSTSFCLLGTAILLLRAQSRLALRFVQTAILLPFIVASLAPVGHLYGVEMIYGSIYTMSSMAVNTAASFVLLTVGLLYSRRDFGLMAPLRSDSPGGILTRRMIPTIFVVSLTVGWLRLQAQQHELLAPEYGLAVHCVLMIAIFCTVVWWVSHYLDQIDQRRLQAEIALSKSRAELSHVLRINTMGEMVAGIAHELNQPLSAIGNFARGTIHRLQQAERPQPDLIDAVESIADESTRAAEILLSLKRYVQNCAPQRLPLDVNLVVRNAIRIVAGEATQRGVRLAIHTQEQLSETLADRVQIQQVLINLICNSFDALEHTPGPKWVRVETLQNSHGGIEISVTDNGCGLPEQGTHRIFDAFYT
ncbi:MAG: hypothetical protein JNG90_16275, partial [Planctomycetaceae bacterium]|nr:hypothetical protein [Planctomycetaceae bacterium]